MEATLTFPEITGASNELDTPPAIVSERTELAKVDLAKVDLADVALARFGDWRGQVSDARKKLDGLVLDLSTQARIDDAKSLRHTLIGKPRAAARSTSKELKSKLSQVGKTVGAAEDQIVAAFDDAEKLITPQIDDAQAAIDEAKRLKAEEEARQAAAEADRKAKHEGAIATITGYVDLARAAASDRIAAGIEYVEAIDVSAEQFEEFAERAATAKDDTLAILREMLVAKQIEEREAAERAEAERVRDAITAINAAVGDCVGAPVDLIEQTLDSIDAIYGDETEPSVAEAREKAIVKIQSLLASARAMALVPPPAPEPATAPLAVAPATRVFGPELDAAIEIIASLHDQQPTEAATDDAAPTATERAVPAIGLIEPAGNDHSTEPTLTLGAIKERLGFTVTAEFVSSLGLTGQKVKTTALYSEQQFTKLCDALVEHIGQVRDTSTEA